MPASGGGGHGDCPAVLVRASGAPPIPHSIPVAKVVRRLEDLTELTLVQWNMLNVEYHVGKYKWNPVTGEFERSGDKRSKPERFLKEQGEILASLGTDLLVAEEIEGRTALEGFVERYMKSQWRTFLERGNDPRGIEVGFLLKNDLPFEVELRQHTDMTWTDPETEEEETLFSRDLPVMILRAPGNPKPLLILVGTHFKSKRDRPNDPQSRRLAKAQADGALEILQGLVTEFGPNAPIVFSGDTNGDFNHEVEFAKLKRKMALEDAFDVVRPPLSQRDRITHSYHPRDEDEPHYSQIDVVAVVPALRACVKRAEVYRYRDARGRVRPLPTTFDERKLNPSDHFPVRVVFDWKCILELWRRR